MLALLSTKLLRPFAGLLAFLVSFVSNIFYSPGVMDMPIVPDDFTPVMRFVVTSDVHLNGDPNQAEAARLARMLQTGRRLALEDPSYQKLDAAAFVGDVCDRGTPETAWPSPNRQSLKAEQRFRLLRMMTAVIVWSSPTQAITFWSVNTR